VSKLTLLPQHSPSIQPKSHTILQVQP